MSTEPLSDLELVGLEEWVRRQPHQQKHLEVQRRMLVDLFSRLQSQSKLIESLREALREARVWLDEYAAEFPTGRRALERIDALLGAGLEGEKPKP
jgi:hypothetical protein